MSYGQYLLLDCTLRPNRAVKKCNILFLTIFACEFCILQFIITFISSGTDGYIFSSTLVLFYKVHYDTQNHANAKASCQLEGGSLLKIDKPEKQQYVEDHMELLNYRSIYNVFYVDGEAVGGNTTVWKFSDGSPLVTFYWAPGQPNTAQPMTIRVSLDKDRKWDDGSGSNKRAYICQRSFWLVFDLSCSHYLHTVVR